ncbi:MAG: PASTA domain-containing protein [Clostridia bacterium]|nr:PASTA domain-containing protein [Clostridia bacterium]
MNIENLCMGCMNEKLTGGPCPVCGYAGEHDNPNALMPKTLLQGRYVIGKTLEVNGEGFTYIAYDTKNSVPVTVREFFPQGHCTRDKNKVHIQEGKEYEFNDTLLQFLELSKTLYSLNGLSALFNTIDIFEENATAYRVSERMRGIPIREFLLRNGGTLTYEQVKSLFVPMLSTVKALHNAGIVHGGLSADTLILCKDGKLRISGFCVRAARMKGQFLTPQLFPGFAAIEQYGSIGTVGPWTDVYGIAATIYRVFVGNPPIEATERLNNDTLSVPKKAAEAIAPDILEMLSVALQILPEDRMQSIEDMRSYFMNATIQMYNTGKIAKPKKEKKKKGSNSKWYAIVAAGVTIVVLVALAVLLAMFFKQKNEEPSTSSLPSLVSETVSQTPSADSTSSTAARLYAVPRFIGQSYSDIIENLDYTDYYEFQIVSKEYNNDYPAGTVFKQSPEAESAVEKGTKVSLYISLGAEKVTVPNLIGCTVNEAKLKLYEAGFPFSSVQIVDKYDESKTPSVIIEVDQKSGDKVLPDARITLYYNTYKGEESADSSLN